MDVTEALVRSGQVGVVLVDSVAALTPKAEIDGEMCDNHVGLQARLMSRAMRKLASLAYQTGTTLVFVNKTGVNAGIPEATTGANALKFYASVRIDVRCIGSLKKNKVVFGNRIRLKVVKNKMAPPFRQCEVDLTFGKGFCREAEVFDLAFQVGVVTRSGAFFKVGDDTVGQGRNRTVANLKERPGLCDAIAKRLGDMAEQDGNDWE